MLKKGNHKLPIKNSRYFIVLFSSTSVQKRICSEGIQTRIGSVIPARLDNSEIPFEKFRSIERVDLFPDWNEGRCPGF
jgi:hypothetical protein